MPKMARHTLADTGKHPHEQAQQFLILGEQNNVMLEVIHFKIISFVFQ